MRRRYRCSHRAWAAFLAACALSACTARRPLGSVNGGPEARAPETATRNNAARPNTTPDPPAVETPSEFSGVHPRVGDFVNAFKTRRRASFQDALARSGRYRMRMVAILEREGVPAELSYLPLIESEYRPSVTSPAGAAGLWQFMRQTGRAYGLRIDAYVDERRDPIKSTRAAARYLRSLHEAFGSWHLALAAYNAGAGRITRALERRGTGTFWDMRRALPRETIDYVPRFLAAMHIARAPEAHGFAEPDDLPLPYDLLRVHGQVALHVIARKAGVSTAELAELNPALIRAVTPPDRAGYRIRLPKGTRSRYVVADRLERA